ncbi:DUF6270 domain-containing protein [Alcaligenaceae bacterium B3P038]|nr:DUF6270 domain-containing protein [Alcaligenaceae bacterium B3P038]
MKYRSEQNMRISILGSCVSRDIFNSETANFEVAFYSARTSIGSLFSAVPIRDSYTSTIKSSFQKRMVRADLRKTTIASFLEVEPDVILIDLIDERFNILRTGTNARFTLSAELRKAMGTSANEFHMITTGSEEFMDFWYEGWHRLVELLKVRGWLDRVLINRVFWQNQTENGATFDVELCNHSNAVLSRMYNCQAETLTERQFIDYGDLLTCPDDHQWGPAPFHFSERAHTHARLTINAFQEK